MNKKEKAKELVEKFYKKIVPEFETNELAQEVMHTLYDEQVKQCALIAVDEILEALDEYDERTEGYLKDEFGVEYMSAELQNMENDWRYWQGVKEEIKQL